jgi:hypothetical protein
MSSSLGLWSIWCRYINRHIFNINLTGIHPVSRNRASFGVFEGTPRILLNKYSSTSLSLCSSSSLTLYHISLLNNIPLNSIASLSFNPTEVLYGPRGISLRIDNISLTIPYPLSVISFLFSVLVPLSAQVQCGNMLYVVIESESEPLAQLPVCTAHCQLYLWLLCMWRCRAKVKVALKLHSLAASMYF